MKKNSIIFRPSMHLLISAAIGMTACLFFSQCTQKPAQTSDTNEGIKTLIVGGGDSHDFDKWFKEVDSRTLSEKGLAIVKYTDNTDSIAHYIQDMDVLYLTNNQPINNPQSRQAILDFVAAGKGLVIGHAGLWYNWADWPRYNQQIAGGGSKGHDKYGSFEVTVTDLDHPVTRGVEKKFSIKDELYYFKIDEKGPGVEVLATAISKDSEVFPSVFVVKNPKSRIVGITLGHDAEAHNLEAYQTILRNAVKWTSGN